MLCAYRAFEFPYFCFSFPVTQFMTGFLVVWENDRFGVSFLEPKVPKGTPLLERLRILQRTYMTFVHTVLIGANTMIIIGGSMLSKAIADEAEGKPANVSTGKSLRECGWRASPRRFELKEVRRGCWSCAVPRSGTALPRFCRSLLPAQRRPNSPPNHVDL